MKLTPKQKRFCQEYLIDLNATQAAIRAGYSPKTAGRIGNENVNKPVIVEYLNELKMEREKNVKIDSDYVLKRLTEMDSLDIADIIEDDGTAKPIKQWPKAWRISISAVDISKIVQADDVAVVVSKIKWPDKTKVLEMIGKHVEVQAFKDRVAQEHSVDTSLGAILRGIDGSTVGL